MHLLGDQFGWFSLLVSLALTSMIGAAQSPGRLRPALVALAIPLAIGALVTLPLKARVTSDDMFTMAVVSLAPFTVFVVAVMVRSLRNEIVGAFNAPTFTDGAPKGPPVFVQPGFSFRAVGAMCEGHTRLEAKRLIEPYLGKWVDVRGVVEDISDLGFVINVKLEGWPSVALDFPRALANQVAAYQRGGILSARGCIRTISEHVSMLEYCELLRGADAEGAILVPEPVAGKAS